VPTPGTTFIGSVNTVYYSPANRHEDDFETIGPTNYAGPYVVGGPSGGNGGQSIYSVYAPLLPAVNATIATHGFITGEVRNIPVSANNAYITYGSNGAAINHVIEIPLNYNGTTDCHSGDVSIHHLGRGLWR